MSASSRAAAILSLAWAAASAAAQGSPLPRTIEFGTVTSLIGKYCSNCHDWASAYKAIIVPARVVPGSPKDSLLWDMIESGQMPLSGPAPSAEEKALIRDWIAAGAPDAVPVSGASPMAPGGAPGPKSTYLGFPSKADFHRFSGWTSGGLLSPRRRGYRHPRRDPERGVDHGQEVIEETARLSSTASRQRQASRNMKLNTAPRNPP